MEGMYSTKVFGDAKFSFHLLSDEETTKRKELSIERGSVLVCLDLVGLVLGVLVGPIYPKSRRSSLGDPTS